MFSPVPYCLILDKSPASYKSSTLRSGQIYELSAIIPGVKIIFSMGSSCGKRIKLQVWQDWRVWLRSRTWTVPSLSPLLQQHQHFTVQLLWFTTWTLILKTVWVQLLFWPAASFSYEMQLKERKLQCSAGYESTKLDWIQETKKWHFFSL